MNDAITPAELHERLLGGEPVRVLDIRDREAVEQWHLTGDSMAFSHIPRTKFLQAKALDSMDDLVADIDGSGPITVVCAIGRASDEVAGFLREAGYEAQNLDGGMEGWADLYTAKTVPTTGPATVIQYERPSSGCLSYMVISEGEAAVIDPLSAFSERYVADAKAHDTELTLAIDTHVHADHVSGIEQLARETEATAVIPVGARDRGATVTAETVADGEAVTVGAVTLSAVYAPGHTTDMTAFYTDGLLFSGDSLFVESVARPDLEAEADGVTELATALYETLHERFARFEDGTVLAPGHHGEPAQPAANGTYTDTLGSVRERLSWLGLDETAFVERILADMPPRPANYEEIIEINLGRAAFEGEETLALELGPNNCAASAD